jgi:O-acetyl-ADP-ribose deacetylase (regulator of RNase III)
MEQITLENTIIELKRGDIAAQDDMDAVVNAANAQLSGGGGVDGALHRAAGPELKEASQPKGPISPGEAVITPAYNLPNEYVIHCLGPVYGQDHPEDQLLANCYENALELAEKNGVKTIAFPSISTGAFGYPPEEAARVSLQAIKEEAPNLSSVKKIRIVLWGKAAMETHQKILQEVVE